MWVERDAVGAVWVESEGAANAFPDADRLEGLFLEDEKETGSQSINRACSWTTGC